MFPFLSFRSSDFDISRARALQEAGVFNLETNSGRNEILNCYTFESNTLLEQKDFYSSSSIKHNVADVATGAYGLLPCLAIEDGLYGSHDPQRVLWDDWLNRQIDCQVVTSKIHRFRTGAITKFGILSFAEAHNS